MPHAAQRCINRYKEIRKRATKRLLSLRVSVAYAYGGNADKKKGTIVWRRQFQDFLALKGTIISRFLISLCSNDRQSRAGFQDFFDETLAIVKKKSYLCSRNQNNGIMKTKLFSFLLALVASVGTIIADGTKIGDLYYNLDADNLTAKVTYQEYMSENNYSGLTSADIPSSVTYDSQTYSVTSIGDSAFYYCTNLTSITIPNSVTSIGEYVFYGCSNVTVYIPSTLSCGALEGATIVRYDAIIGDYVFKIGDGSADLMTIDPETLNNTINKCWAITYTYAGISATDYIWSTERECVMALQQAQKMISTGTYSYKPASANDENSCYQLSVDAQNAQERKEVHNNYQTTVLDTAASWYLFAYIGKEQHLTLPTRVEGKVYGISQRAFQNSNIQSIVLPNGLTSIGDCAFADCSSLKNIIVPDGVQRVGEYAFMRCSALTEVTCNAEIIGTRAWEGCSSLVKVNILEGCDSIGDYAFTGCGSLTSVYNYAATPQAIDSYVFYGVNVNTCTLYVPEGSIALYQSANVWKEFENILPIAAEGVETESTTVETSETTAEITWPEVSGAYTYELIIRDKNGNIVCTLIFNANGQLTQIAFGAPARDNATQASGFSFTVTGLDSGTSYDLTITAKDENGAVLQTTTQSFTTAGGASAVDNVNTGDTRLRKMLIDGQLLIINNGKTYNALGARVK